MSATAPGRAASLEPAPVRPVAPRWSESIATGAVPVVLADRVVVAEPSPASSAIDDDMLRITARELTTGRVAWWVEVPEGASTVLVDTEAGQVRRLPTLPRGAVPGAGPTLGISVVDGRRLWRRPAAGPGGWTGTWAWDWSTIAERRVLLLTDEGCEAVDPMTGRVAWTVEDALNCWVADRGRVVVSHPVGWQVRAGDGAVLARLDLSASEPVLVGDLVVRVQGRDVIATDMSGTVRWRAQHPWVRAVPRPVADLGVAAVDGGGRDAVGFDLAGRRMELPSDVLLAQQVDVAGRRLAVVVAWGFEQGAVRVHEGTGRGQQVAATDRVLAPTRDPFTRHGVLLADPPDGPAQGGPTIGLYGYADLAPRWTVELHGAPVHLATGSTGLVVVTGDGDDLVMHGYA